jgi:hypothetical protein
MKMSPLPVRSESKAIIGRSGDQVGEPSDHDGQPERRRFGLTGSAHVTIRPQHAISLYEPHCSVVIVFGHSYEEGERHA